MEFLNLNIFVIPLLCFLKYTFNIYIKTTKLYPKIGLLSMSHVSILAIIILFFYNDKAKYYVFNYMILC